MFSSLLALSGALSLFSLFPSTAANTARGLAWATDNRFAPIIGDKPLITWYHHWQDGPVSQMPSNLEYVPMFWGPSKWDLWNSRVSEMKKKKPAHLMGFNEPDVSGQSNMDANYAAELWMEQIHPWGKKGVKLISPAIVYNLQWMDTFLKALHSKGGYIDMMAIHWYGSWKDVSGFKNWVQTVHTRYGYKLWITELGITTSSNPTQAQTKDFMMQVYSWMDTTGYVLRASWFGCFIVYQPPDNYATGKNALFKAPYTLSDMGYWYGYSEQPDRRAVLDRRNHHHFIAARNSNETDSTDEGDHCDEICKLREAQYAELPPFTP